MTPLLQTLSQPLLLSPGHTAPVTGPELMSPMSCMQVTEHLGQVPAPASPDSTQWPLSPHPFSSSPDREGKTADWDEREHSETDIIPDTGCRQRPVPSLQL